MEQLNGFELAGKNIRLTTVDDEEGNGNSNGNSYTQFVPEQKVQQTLESEDRMNLNAQGRFELMAKLAEGLFFFLENKVIEIILGTGLQIPQNTRDVLSHHQTISQNDGIPSIATQCFMLSSMFDPTAETEEGWELDVRDDVIEECNSHGGKLN